MPSLLELVERVNKGELIDSTLLEVYQESSNSAEKFLANHARAMLELRRSHTYLLEALEAIDYADQKVLFQFLSVLGFLGMTDQRADPIIRFAAAAIHRREASLGLEALQAGVFQQYQSEPSFLRDQELMSRVTQQYERASQIIGWVPPATGVYPSNGSQIRIGYLTSCLTDDESTSRFLLGISKYLDQKDFKLCVYSTECNVRREKLTFTQGPFTASSAKRGKETIETLNRRKASVWLTPVDQDPACCARELGQQIIRDQIDVLIIDANFADPIASVVVCWPVSRIKLNLVRRWAMLAGSIDAAIYIDAHLKKQDETLWIQKGRPVHFLQEGIEPLSNPASMVQRSSYGIPDQSIILSTTCDSEQGLEDSFQETLVHLLRQYPQTVLLIAGEVEQQQVRRRFDSTGLGKRVGFAGRRKDLSEFLGMTDIYLAAFPRPHVPGLLSAMNASRAIVALSGDPTDPQRPEAIIGAEHTSGDIPGYIEHVGRLVRDPSSRARTGESMKTRVTSQFGYEQTARSLEQICRSLLQVEQSHREAA
ncbi:MAG: hypothetical protein KatS3mg104_2601 [Phycisphaerae bacterium]|nr:MAG: hypothetical protein KatS3mg104_2601 [Phycisphaerae bacterium]